MPESAAPLEGIAVRPARTADLPGIRAVAARTWRATYAGLIPDEDIERFLAEAYEQGRLQQSLRWLGTGMLVATRADEVVGYAYIGGAHEGRAEVYAIYVTPEWQGRGVGWGLWSAAIEHARNGDAKEVVAWVLGDNAPARRFYERQGGRSIGERGFPVGAGEVREAGYTFSVR